ncbi:MAG: peptide ABC transporter substrate-binding protein, partial [Ruminiclostridium sp.]|nr:peptide ABC transporter substrate-binding protein [Ruminiclostridium sp.]
MLAAAVMLSGCRDSGDDEDPKKGYNYYFTSVIDGSPATLDPQTCTGDTAAQIVANVFRGLYRVSDGGEVIPAMAESAEVSSDGLVWKFRLSENVKWYGSDGFTADCTAEDFVFGFQRLVNPALRSTRAKEYYCIKNAEQINKGIIKDLTALGVEATDKYELTITLTEPRTDIESLLAAAPAMPCNREFYERTEGQYGLVGECVGSNGAFYVGKWHYDRWMKDGNFIDLRRNDLNAEALGTAAKGVKLLINADGYESFLNGTTDLYRTSDPDEIFRLSGRYDCDTFSDGVWGVLFNTEGVFESADFRIALGGYVSGEFDGDIYIAADRIIPDGAAIGTVTYRNAAGLPIRVSYSEAELLERGTRAMRELEEGALSGMKLLIPEGTALRQSIGAVIQQWQRNFGVYCTISELPAADYISALEAGSFGAAMVRLGGGGGAVSYLTCFSSASPKNYGGVNSPKLEDILSGALTAKSDTTAAAYCLEAEQLVLDNCWFAPLCFEKEYVFRASGISGVEYDPTCGGYYFAYGKK